ncbi:MAG: hypothetical protein ACE5F1_10580 [Planctomycetota bacterium]
MSDRRTKRDLHALDENGMLLCNHGIERQRIAQRTRELPRHGRTR